MIIKEFDRQKLNINSKIRRIFDVYTQNDVYNKTQYLFLHQNNVGNLQFHLKHYIFQQFTLDTK
jgi:hypothetical protein